MVLRWHLTFLRPGQICFPCICMGTIHLYGENVENIHILDISSIIQLNRNLMSFRTLMRRKLAKWADRKSKMATTAPVFSAFRYMISPLFFNKIYYWPYFFFIGMWTAPLLWQFRGCLFSSYSMNWQRYLSNYYRPRWLSWMRRPTGDQEVAGSTPSEVGNILSWRLIMKYFLRSFSPFRWFKKGSCQFLAKECTILVNRLED